MHYNTFSFIGAQHVNFVKRGRLPTIYPFSIMYIPHNRVTYSKTPFPIHANPNSIVILHHSILSHLFHKGFSNLSLLRLCGIPGRGGGKLLPTSPPQIEGRSITIIEDGTLGTILGSM